MTDHLNVRMPREEVEWWAEGHITGEAPHTQRANAACREALEAERDGRAETWTREQIASIMDYLTTHRDYASMMAFQAVEELTKLFDAHEPTGAPRGGWGDRPAPEPTTEGAEPKDSECRWPHGYLDPQLGHCPNCGQAITDVPDIRADERRVVLGRVVERLEAEVSIPATYWSTWTWFDGLRRAIAIVRAEMEGNDE